MGVNQVNPNLNQEDESVSPVIATVLLLAITVMLTSMVFVLFQGVFDNLEKQAPRVNVSLRELNNGYTILSFTTVSKPLDPIFLRLSLVPNDFENETGQTIHASDAEVYGRIGSNISFIDSDAGYTVTEGDYFVLNSSSFGFSKGYTVVLYYENTNTVLSSIQMDSLSTDV